MISDEQKSLELRLEALVTEHRDLDTIIRKMVDDPMSDQLQLVRLKKRKLMFKDEIERIRSKLIPDLNA
jgi:hypothetical protein